MERTIWEEMRKASLSVIAMFGAIIVGLLLAHVVAPVEFTTRVVLMFSVPFLAGLFGLGLSAYNIRALDRRD